MKVELRKTGSVGTGTVITCTLQSQYGYSCEEELLVPEARRLIATLQLAITAAERDNRPGVKKLGDYGR